MQMGVARRAGMSDYQYALDYLAENIKTLNRHCTDGSFCNPNWSVKKLQEAVLKAEIFDEIAPEAEREEKRNADD